MFFNSKQDFPLWKVCYKIFCLYFVFPFLCFAQIEETKAPRSFNPAAENFSNIATLPLQIMSYNTFDNSNLRQSDSLVRINNTSYRMPIGVSNYVNTNFKDVAEVISNNGNDKIYRLMLTSSGALQLGLLLDNLALDVDAELFVYNPSHSISYGAFTRKTTIENMQRLTIRALEDDTVIVELYEPNYNNSSFRIRELVHYYRTSQINGAADCNIDVDCGGVDYSEIQKSVIKIITHVNGQTSESTGTIMNTTSLNNLAVKNDNHFYVMLAFHALESGIVGDCNLDQTELDAMIETEFIYNYKQNGCLGSTLLTSHSTVGCQFRTAAIPVDIALVELIQKPQHDWDVYLAGWDASSVLPISGTTIHHPKGDIKKISYTLPSTYATVSLEDHPYTCAQGPTTTYYLETQFNLDINGNNGIVELGSSGAPLFNQNQRVVGCLHETTIGSSLVDPCLTYPNDPTQSFAGKDGFAWFGKLSSAWSLGSLSSYLTGSGGATYIDGINLSDALCNNNATDYLEVQADCGPHCNACSEIWPDLDGSVKNLGQYCDFCDATKVINNHEYHSNQEKHYIAETSVTFNSDANGNGVTVKSNADVKFRAIDIDIQDGFETKDGAKFEASGGFTCWDGAPCIVNNGRVGNPNSENVTKDQFNTDGKVQVKNNYSYNAHSKKVNNINQSPTKTSEFNFSIIPNPNNGAFTITTNNASTITITNILGEVVYKTQSTGTNNEINLNSNAKGIYFVTVKGEGINETKKVIVE